MADIATAESAIQGAVVETTHSKQALAWSRYKTYLQSIGIIEDWYLDNFTKHQKHKILSAFGTAIRDGRFSKQNKPNKSGSVRSAIDHVAQTYKLAHRPDPRLDTDAKFAFILQRQIRSYKNSDNPETQQVAVTGSILREFYKLSISKVDKALCQLFIGAFFFAMRSCEYLKVSGTRKTKLLKIENIRFFKGKRLIHHKDKGLHKADSISITFECQKRDTKNDVITHHCTPDDLLCPVKIWSRIVKRLMSYPSTNPETKVNTFMKDDGSLYEFSGPELLSRLRRAAQSLGQDNLGFHHNQIGLHSARSGAAMAMYLAGVPVVTIMLLGRWSSDAFLRYIRKQVQEFSTGVSAQMIQRENFFTVPLQSQQTQKNTNHVTNKAAQSKNGLSFRNAIRPLIKSFS